MPPKRNSTPQPIRANPPRPSPYRRPTKTLLGPAPPVSASPPGPLGCQDNGTTSSPKGGQGGRDLSNIDPRLRSETATMIGTARSTPVASSSNCKQVAEKEDFRITDAATSRKNEKGKTRAFPMHNYKIKLDVGVSQEEEREAGSDEGDIGRPGRPVARKRVRRIIESEDEEDVVAVKGKGISGKVEHRNGAEDPDDDSDPPTIRQRASRAERPWVTPQVSTRRNVPNAVRTPTTLYSARQRTYRHSPIELFSSNDSRSQESQDGKELREVLDLTVDDSDASEDGGTEVFDDKDSEYDLDGLIDDGEIVEHDTDADPEADIKSDSEVRSDAGSVKTDCSGAYAAIERAERILASRSNRTRSNRARNSAEPDTNAVGRGRLSRAINTGAGKKDVKRKTRRVTRSRPIHSRRECTNSNAGSNANTVVGSEGSGDDHGAGGDDADDGDDDGDEDDDDGYDDCEDDPDREGGEAGDVSSNGDEDDLDINAELPELPNLDPLQAKDLIYTEYALRPGVEITRRHREKLERKVKFQRIIIMLVVRFRNGIDQSKTVLDKILYRKRFKEHWDELMYRTRWAAERLERVSWSQGGSTFHTVYKQFTEYHIDPFSLGEDCTGCLRYHEICWSYSDVRLLGDNYNAETFIPEPNANWRPVYTLGTDCFKSWLEARELYHLVYFRFCEFEKDSFVWKRMKPKIRALISQTQVNIDKIVRLFDKTGMSKQFMLHFDRKIRTAQRRRSELFQRNFIQPG